MLNMNNWHLEDFRVVISGAQKVTTATVKIYKKKLVFSKTAAAELDYPQYVRLLVSEEADKIVVIPHFEQDMTAVPFFVPNENGEDFSAAKPISVVEQTLVRSIRTRMAWNDPKARVCNALRFHEFPDALFFDLSLAKIATRSHAASVTEVFEGYPPLKAIIKSMSPVVIGLPGRTE